MYPHPRLRGIEQASTLEYRTAGGLPIAVTRGLPGLCAARRELTEPQADNRRDRIGNEP